MGKVILKDKQSLGNIKDRMRGTVSYRQIKDGTVIASKWPRSKKGRKKTKND